MSDGPYPPGSNSATAKCAKCVVPNGKQYLRGGLPGQSGVEIVFLLIGVSFLH